MSYLDTYIPICKSFEGSVAWMYLDTVGKVTVGVGNMLPDVASALKLPFRVQSSGDVAGAPAVAADFNRVRSMNPGMVRNNYKEYESLILAPEDIDELLCSRLNVFDFELRQDYPAFLTYSDGRKMALVDMRFNLGRARMNGEYVHFNTAVLTGDWTKAAAECGRNVTLQSFYERNKWTRQQFLEAA